MKQINDILDEYRGMNSTPETRREIQYKVAKLMRVHPDNVALEHDDFNILSVRITKKMFNEPINVLGELAPREYLRGYEADYIAIDEHLNDGSNIISAEGGVLTKECLEDMKDYVMNSFGQVEKRINPFNQDTSDRTMRKLEELRARIRDLEDQVHRQSQDIDHYKMLSQEN